MSDKLDRHEERSQHTDEPAILQSVQRWSVMRWSLNSHNRLDDHLGVTITDTYP